MKRQVRGQRLNLLYVALLLFFPSVSYGDTWFDSHRPAGQYYSGTDQIACKTVQALGKAPVGIKIENKKILLPNETDRPEEFHKLGCRSLSANNSVQWDGKQISTAVGVIGKIVTADGSTLFTYSNLLSDRPAQVMLGSSGEARDLDEEERNVITNAVGASLKDSDSAKFKLPRYTRATLYCGLVNAKNSFGGYSGFTLFSVMTKTNKDGKIEFADKVSFYQDGDPLIQGFIAMCATYGYSF